MTSNQQWGLCDSYTCMRVLDRKMRLISLFKYPLNPKYLCFYNLSTFSIHTLSFMKEKNTPFSISIPLSLRIDGGLWWRRFSCAFRSLLSSLWRPTYGPVVRPPPLFITHDGKEA